MVIRILGANTHDQLLGKVLLERGVVAEVDLRRLYAESGYHQNNGNSVSLGQLLVHNRLLDPQYFQNLEQEIAHAGRSCGRCQQVFMKAPTAPEYCPACQLPISRVAANLSQNSPNPIHNPSPSLFQSAYSPPPSGSYQSAGYSPTAAPMGQHLSGSFNMNQASGVMPAMMNQPSGQIPAAIPVPGMSPQQAAMLSGKFRMPLNGIAPTETKSGSSPPATRPDSRPEGGPKFGDKLSSGSRFCGHEILCELGRGGMGVVYKAKSDKTGEIVALKVLLAGEFASKKVIKRFKDEISVLSNLDHPNIIPIRESGEENGVHFFTMAFVEGCGLDSLIKERKVSMRRGLEIVATVCEAIHQAHEIDIVHRDLKPGNIMVDKDGVPYVMDFGLAKDLEANHSMTRSGVPIGTPYYMPPEQARGDHKSIDERADIYALGAVLYEIITHRVPFKAATTTELMRMIIEDDPTPPKQLRPHCTREYEAITLKALAKDMDDRYDSALDMADDISAALAGRPIQASTGGIGTKIKRFVKKNKKAVGICLGVVLLAALIGFFVYNQQQSELQAEKDKERLRIEKEKAREEAERLKREKEAQATKEEEDRKRREAEQAQRIKDAKLLADINEIRSRVSKNLGRARSSRNVPDWRKHSFAALRALNDLFEKVGDKGAARDFYQRAQVHQSLGNFKAALADYKQAASDPSHRARGQFSYGFLKYLLTHDTRRACEELDKAIPSSKNDSNSVREIEREAADLATAYSGYLRDPSSVNEGLRSLPISSNFVATPYIRSEFHMFRAMKGRSRPELGMAYEAIKKAQSFDTFDYFVLVQTCFIELRLNQSSWTAPKRKAFEKRLKIAEAINQALPDVYQVRALYLAALKRKSDAMMAVQKAMTNAKDKDIFRDELRKLGTEIERALKGVPDSIPDEPVKPGPGRKAFKIVKETPVLEPAQTLTEDEFTPKTLSVLAINFSCSFKVKENMPHWLAANQAFKQKDFEQVFQKLEAILKTEPKHFKVRVFKAYMLMEKTKKIDEAAAILQTLYKEHPKNLWVRKFLGVASLRQNKVAECYKLFVGVIKEAPKDFESVYYVCRVLQASKKYPELVSLARSALKVFPNNYTLLGYVIEGLIHLDKWKEAAPIARQQMIMRQTGTSVVRTLFVLAAARDFSEKDAFYISEAQKAFKPNNYLNYAIGIFNWSVRGDKGSAIKILNSVAKTKNALLGKVAQRDLKELSK